jgi:CheY-like chemotaxis protein
MSETPHLLYVGSTDDDADTATPDTPAPATLVTSAADALSELVDRDYDAVICEQELPGDDTGLDVLAAIREQYDALPVVLRTAEPDGTVAARATQLAVTEYVPRSDVDLATRVADILSGSDASADSPADSIEHRRELQSNNAALRELAQLATEDGLTETETVERALDIGRRRLGVSLGFLNRIGDGTHEVAVMVGEHSHFGPGTTTPIADTYCDRVIETGEMYEVADATDVVGGPPIAQKTGMSCYIGNELSVNGTTYGTLCFADSEPRPKSFSDSSRRFSNCWPNG